MGQPFMLKAVLYIDNNIGRYPNWPRFHDFLNK